MFDNIYGFGCSYTWGAGLKDQTTSIPETPSVYSYLSLLNSYFPTSNIINKSWPGASNKLICNTIIETDFLPNSIAIVQWTFISRYCTFHNDKRKPEQYGPLFRSTNSKTWLKYFYSEEDVIRESNMYIMLVDYYFKANNIPYIFLANDYTLENNLRYHNLNIRVTKQFEKDKALDNVHPGTKSHEAVANFVANNVEKKYNEQKEKNS